MISITYVKSENKSKIKLYLLIKKAYYILNENEKTNKKL